MDKATVQTLFLAQDGASQARAGDGRAIMRWVWRCLAGWGLALWLGCTASIAQPVPESRTQIQLSFAPLVKAAAPAVVNVYTRRVVRQEAGPFADPLFRQFFGNRLPFGLPQERVQNALGSGVIVAGDGTIVTNHHVIRGADEITIILADRREFEATVVLSDERTDLAILKIKAEGSLPFLNLANSDAVEVGDMVLAIGNPFGVGQTVTMGIVSAVARSTGGINDFGSFIQTDAAINPGNSGGALIGIDGRLIGVNTAIFSRTGGSIGIGFAIPANMLRVVLDGAKHGGRVVRPWLGAQLQPLTTELAASLGLDRPLGVILREVVTRGPADEAGLKAGDVITAIDGHEVADIEGLRYRIATLPLGQAARVTYRRAGAVRTGRLLAIAPPAEPPANKTVLGGKTPLAGVTIANLSPALADEIGSAVERGVVVLEVAPGSFAERIQVQAGDILLRIGGKDIGQVEQVEPALRERPQPWQFKLRRGGDVMQMSVRG